MSASQIGWRSTGHSPVLGIGSLPFWMAGGLLALSLTLGGGTRQGLGSDAVIELVSFGVIAASLLRGMPQLDGLARSAFVLISATIALPLLQLVPLPPAVWTTLPGRSLMIEVYERAGLPLPWLPVSLDPHATWRSVVSLFPALAIFMVTIHLAWPARRTLVVLVLATAIVSVILGLAQLMEGPNSTLRFFPITNNQDSVGFFANRNHYAALLYCLIPFAAAWMVGLLKDRRPERSLGLLLAALAYLVLVLGIAMARSRAGVFLAMLTTLSSVLLTRSVAGRLSRVQVLGIAAAVACALAVSLHYGLVGLLAKFNDGVIDSFRLIVDRTALSAARAFLPLGSGFGTFVPVYQMFESPAGVLAYYVNHAHNDWLETLLEGGWPALVIGTLFLVWFLFASIKTWTNKNWSGLDHAIGCAATIALAALLLHSFVDYPLRTIAMTALFALWCSLLVDPQKGKELMTETSGSRLPKWLRSIQEFRSRRRMRGWQDGGFG